MKLPDISSLGLAGTRFVYMCFTYTFCLVNAPPLQIVSCHCLTGARKRNPNIEMMNDVRSDSTVVMEFTVFARSLPANNAAECFSCHQIQSLILTGHRKLRGFDDYPANTNN